MQAAGQSAANAKCPLERSPGSPLCVWPARFRQKTHASTCIRISYFGSRIIEVWKWFHFVSFREGNFFLFSDPQNRAKPLPVRPASAAVPVCCRDGELLLNVGKVKGLWNCLTYKITNTWHRDSAMIDRARNGYELAPAAKRGDL
jgi:hypothetical protein